MPRQRFIHPTLWEDPVLGSLPEAHVLLYIACFSLADDEGRLRGDPRYLKGAAWMYRNTSVNRLKKMRDDLSERCSQFVVYEHGGDEYIAFLNWRDFQKPKYPTASKLPPPSGSLPPALEEPSPKPSLRVGQGLEGMGRAGLEDQHSNQEKEIELEKLVRAVGGANGKTSGILRPLVYALPLAVVADVRERAQGKGAGWAVNALKAIREEKTLAELEAKP